MKRSNIKWEKQPSQRIIAYLCNNGLYIKDQALRTHLRYNGWYGKHVGQRLDYRTKECFEDQFEIDSYTNFISNNEYLYLSYCEALYIGEFFNLLTCYNGNQIISLDSLRSVAISNSHNFSKEYAVYKYFREFGWVVGLGLHYGCNFVIYKQSPEQCHSNAGIFISDREEYNSLDFESNAAKARMRVLSHVKKDLIYCYVKNDNVSICGVVARTKENKDSICYIKEYSNL
uniref:tRNA-intron lyase n=1 Tax=Rhabditophanes sp. KR3021 TaxID=114890 RepID=A0AC35UI83_9BILA